MSSETVRARLKENEFETDPDTAYMILTNVGLDGPEANLFAHALTDLPAALAVIEAAKAFYDEDGAHIEKRQSGSCSAGCGEWPCRHQLLAEALDAFEALP